MQWDVIKLCPSHLKSWNWQVKPYLMHRIKIWRFSCGTACQQRAYQISAQKAFDGEGWREGEGGGRNEPSRCDFTLGQTISNDAHFIKFWKLKKSKKYDPTKKTNFPLKCTWKQALFLGFFFPGSRPWIPGKRECQKSGNSREIPVPGFPADTTSLNNIYYWTFVLNHFRTDQWAVP